MGYPSGVNEYILTRLENQHNKTQIAREIKREFRLTTELDAVRKYVARLAEKVQVSAKSTPVMRLFFDIETSPMTFWGWRPGQQYVRPENIIQHSRIICIGYKWQHEDKVKALEWNKDQDDSVLIRKFIKILGKADEIVGHNIDKFDLPIVRARAMQTDNLMYARYRTFDTLKKSRRYFRFPSNKLDELGKYLGVGQKTETGGADLWKDVTFKNDRKALSRMVSYCKNDVILTEDVFHVMMPFVDHNINHAVLKHKAKWCCPECLTDEVSLSHTDSTPMGYIKRNMKCHKCRKTYHISNKTYLNWILHLRHAKEIAAAAARAEK